jgi:hypothetical protein
MLELLEEVVRQEPTGLAVVPPRVPVPDEGDPPSGDERDVGDELVRASIHGDLRMTA